MKTNTGIIFSALSNPVQRALAGAGIKTPKDLATYSEKEIATLHGIGPSSFPILRTILKAHGHTFKK